MHWENTFKKNVEKKGLLDYLERIQCFSWVDLLFRGQPCLGHLYQSPLKMFSSRCA